MEWISVKDRLPEEQQYIIFYINDNGLFLEDRIATGIYEDGQFCDDHGFNWGLETTHWMPLPKPPKS